MNYRYAKEQSKILEKEISVIRQKIKELPPGKLSSTKNGKYTKWYHLHNHKKTYIPKYNRKFAEQLAIKKFLSLKYDELLQEKTAIDSYLLQYESIPFQSEKLLSIHSEYQELLTPFFAPVSKELQDWMQEPYQSNPKYPEQLSIHTISGHMVRSKSEALIDMALYMNKIPFRYECALHLDNITIYPDFTIRHPVTGQIIYWEHFGLMDDPGYSRKAFSKLQLYNSHGLVPSVHLITTFETLDNPLSPDTIEKTIDFYFR